MANILKRLRELASREATCMPPGWQDEYAIYADAADEIERLRAALSVMVYETTCLSAEEDDGSHWCKISREALAKSRAALKEPE